MRVVLLLLVGAVAACERPADPNAGALEAARAFYAWYQAPADSADGGGSFRRAIEQRRGTFSTTLRAALEEDLAAAKADSEYIVGLDFDPFTASQDPCERYEPGAVTRRDSLVLIAVLEHCTSSTSRGAPLTLEMLNENGGWRIHDIAFADGTRLSQVLARLREDRASERSPDAAQP